MVLGRAEILYKHRVGLLVRLGARTSDAILAAIEEVEARQLSDRIWEG